MHISTWRAPYCLAIGFDMNRLAIPTLIGLTLPSHPTFVYKHGDTTRPSPKLGFVVEPAPSLLYHSFTSHLALSMSLVFCMCLVSPVFLSSRNSIDLSCIPSLHLEPPSTRTSTPSFGPPWYSCPCAYLTSTLTVALRQVSLPLGKPVACRLAHPSTA